MSSPSSPERLNSEDVQKHWEDEAKRLIRVELARDGITYGELAKRFQAVGIKETEVSIRNKVSRGTFPATFLLQCMSVLGVNLVAIRSDRRMEVVLSPEILNSIEGLKLPPGFKLP